MTANNHNQLAHLCLTLYLYPQQRKHGLPQQQKHLEPLAVIEFPMSLHHLIEEYKSLTQVCANVDYSDKKSVKANNRAVDKMYQIIDAIGKEYGADGIQEFGKLLDTSVYKTNLWAAIQLLERLPVSKDIEAKALNIIEQDAIHSIGTQYWLKQWKEKPKSNYR